MNHQFSSNYEHDIDEHNEIIPNLGARYEAGIFGNAFDRKMWRERAIRCRRITKLRDGIKIRMKRVTTFFLSLSRGIIQLSWVEIGHPYEIHFIRHGFWFAGKETWTNKTIIVYRFFLNESICRAFIHITKMLSCKELEEPPSAVLFQSYIKKKNVHTG